MKKSTLVTILVLVVIIAAIVWFGRSPAVTPTTNETVYQGTSNTPVVVTEITKVSAKTSKFENAELGFTVNYPTTWESNNNDNGVTFVMPIDKTQVSTVNKLRADISVGGGKCAFPPVTTVKDRSTITVGTLKLNTISMSNTVQGRNYFDRMYSLQKDNTCYLFTFSSITLSPESQKLTGSNKTQAENNNKAIISTADTAFTDMVKTFAFITGPAGQDEAQVAPVKK
ncbi:MAG: hypothetical protein WC666_01225 [Candidatus Paceibacterota bacterium]|jgi:hypothetical protein